LGVIQSFSGLSEVSTWDVEEKMMVKLLVTFCISLYSIAAVAGEVAEGGSGEGNRANLSLDEEDAPKVINALKQHPKCRSLVLIAKNVTAVIWIENGKMLSGRYLWNPNARNTLSNGTTGSDLNVTKLDQELPEPNLYKTDPMGTAKKLEALLDQEVAKQNAAGKFQCNQPLTS